MLMFSVASFAVQSSGSLAVYPASIYEEKEASELIPFDWESAEWIIFDEVDAARHAEEYATKMEADEAKRTNGEKRAFAENDWEPSIPYGGAQNITEAQWPVSMQRGMELNMPTDAKDRFKTPMFWYGAPGSGRTESYIDADGKYVKGTHDPLSDERSNVGYITTNLENEMWFEELDKNAQFQGENRRMQYRLMTGIPHYRLSVSSPVVPAPENVILNRTFNMICAVFSKPSVFTPEEVKALGKPVVLLHAQIHGNENTPGEAMLQVAKELAEGKHDDVLDKVTVVMLPRINPTGAWNNTRGLQSVMMFGNGGQAAGGFDMNRDNVGFESFENKFVRYIANQYNPICGIDGHEQGGTYDSNEQVRSETGTYSSNGYYRGYDMAISVSTSNNFNIHKDVRGLARFLFEPFMKKALEDSKVGWNWYRSGTLASLNLSTTTYPSTRYTDGMGSSVSADFIVPVIASNGTGPVDGRLPYRGTNTDSILTTSDAVIMNAIGLGNQSIHFCIEGSRMTSNSIPRLGALRVVYGHYLCSIALLKTTAEYLDSTIMPVIKNARELEIERKQPLTFWAKPAPHVDESTWNVLEYKDWRKENIPEVVNQVAAGVRQTYEVRAWYATISDKPESWVMRPTAYILHKDHYLAAARLFYTGNAKIERLLEDTDIPVEGYVIREIGATTISEQNGGSSTPQIPTGIRQVSSFPTVKTFPKDSFVVRMDTLGGIMSALLLEPMGTNNFGNMWISRSQGTSGNTLRIPEWYRDNFLPAQLNEEFPAYRYTASIDQLKTYPARLNLPFMLTAVERVHSPNQGDIAKIKAQLNLDTDPEYVSLFELPVLSTDISYKSMSNVHLNEAFLLHNGTEVKIKAENILNGNDWNIKSLSYATNPPVVLIVAPKGFNSKSDIYIAENGGTYEKIFEAVTTPGPGTKPGKPGNHGDEGCAAAAYPLTAILLVALAYMGRRKKG
jgi:hypothetical protein